GYTTLMDLAILEKKTFLIPTPGQPDQEYLAARLQKKGIAPFCRQQDFDLSELKRLKDYSGIKLAAFTGSLSRHFALFKGE
ncbi:MAG: glycosyltransferase, partial [Salinimicrobium sp.]